MKKNDLIKSLNLARKMELENETLNFKDEFTVAPQISEGISIWAKWIKEKRLQPFEVLWAFKETEPRQWLAVRIEVSIKEFSFSEQPNKNIFFFNLQNFQDRQKLKRLEKEITSYLNTETK